MNTTEDSAAMDTKDKCPHCGADEISYGWYRCGACFTDKEPTPLCKERAARQKAEAERDRLQGLRDLAYSSLGASNTHARNLSAELVGWRQKLDRTKEELTETRRKLEELEELAKACAAWFIHEATSPNYPAGCNRDSPGGEAIWTAWWDENVNLCRRATELSHAYIEKQKQDEAEKGNEHGR